MEYTFRRGTISTEDFIIAIAVGCPFGSNYLQYMNALLSLNPKNKNELWIRFCKILRRSEAPVIRSWRIWAHKLYVSQFEDIEREFVRRSIYMSIPSNSLKIASYLDKLVKDNLMPRKEVDSAKSYLRQCGYFGVKDDGDSSDSDSNSGASCQTTVSHGDNPCTSGNVESKEDNGDAAQNHLGEEEIQPIDITQLSPERTSEILTFLYVLTGLALADDDLINKMNGLTTNDNDYPRNLKDPNVLEESRSQLSASSLIQSTKDSSKTIPPTTLDTMSRLSASSEEEEDEEEQDENEEKNDEDEDENEEDKDEDDDEDDKEKVEKAIKTFAQSITSASKL